VIAGSTAADHIDLAASGVFAATLLVPGVGLALLLFRPGTVSIPIRFAVAGALGYGAVAIVSLGLALAGSLRLPAFLAVGGGVSAAVWVLALRGGRGRAHLVAVRDEGKRDAVKLAVFLVFLAVFGLAHATWSPLTNLGVPTTFRYWSDGVEMAETHAVPSRTLQWNRWLEPTKSKIALNAVDAVAALELGRDPMRPMGALLFVVSLLVAVSAYALADALGFGVVSVLLPVFVFANLAFGSFGKLTRDLAALIAEDWGRMVAIAAASVAVLAIKGASRHLEWRLRPPPAGREAPPWIPITVAGALFGVSAATHLVPTVLSFAFVAGYGVVRALVEWKVLSVLAVGLSITLATLVVGGAILVAPGGDLGFQGAGGTKAYDALRRDLGMPPSFDPTLFLLTNGTGPISGHLRYGTTDAIHDFLLRANGERPGSSAPVGWLPVLVALALAAFLLLVGDRDVRSAAGAAVVLGGLILAVAVVFASRYDLYVLAAFGKRRLFDYLVFPYAILAVAAVSFLARLLARLLRGRGRWALVASAVSAVVALAAVVAMVPDVAMNPGEARRYRADYKLLTWIGRNDPCDGRVLIDRRTLASLESLSSRVGVLEGMGPHVRPDVLEIAIREILQAKRFFEEPSDGEPYLERNGVAMVVGTNGRHRLAGWRPLGPTSKLDEVPFLHVVHVSPAGTVYAVQGYAPVASLPDPATAPGYGCGRPPG
jgi:hypothetical protein